ncbi:hypothetical protein OUZ56_010621 [Daphnia magna]|uniref:Uncharacterized protein n=1 Tax=Daphnia magna TaxID=35525 RepID=A0ABR0AJ55_9CRUS|nr:hypothetical protein OUZ56_010621 [Daphnia magna]
MLPWPASPFWTFRFLAASSSCTNAIFEKSEINTETSAPVFSSFSSSHLSLLSFDKSRFPLDVVQTYLRTKVSTVAEEETDLSHDNTNLSEANGIDNDACVDCNAIEMSPEKNLSVTRDEAVPSENKSSTSDPVKSNLELAHTLIAREVLRKVPFHIGGHVIQVVRLPADLSQENAPEVGAYWVSFKISQKMEI